MAHAPLSLCHKAGLWILIRPFVEGFLESRPDQMFRGGGGFRWVLPEVGRTRRDSISRESWGGAGPHGSSPAKGIGRDGWGVFPKFPVGAWARHIHERGCELEKERDSTGEMRRRDPLWGSVATSIF